MSCIETRPLKERPYHRHTLRYFFKTLDSFEKNINTNLEAKKYGRDMYIQENNIEYVERYNCWIEDGLKELEGIWEIKKAVNKVMANFKHVTVGFHSSRSGGDEILAQKDEIIRYLSSVKRNSFDYEKVIEFEKVLQEVTEMADVFYKKRWEKRSKMEKRRNELRQIEYNLNEITQEKYRKYMEITEVFLTDDEKNELNQCREFILYFQHPVFSMSIHNYQHTVDTLKQLKKEIEERLGTEKYVIERTEL